MKTALYHLQINVSNAATALPFCKDFFAYFEYRVIDESPEHIGVSNSTTDFWIIETETAHRRNPYHRKNTGINHLAFRVSSKEEVDRFCKEFLEPRGIKSLYGSPKLFPEYTENYYAVFFEGPDRLKLEVVYL